MGKINEVLTNVEQALAPFKPEEVRLSMQDRLKELGREDISILDVSVEMDGDVIVEFGGAEGDSVEVLFGCDLTDEVEEDCYAMVLGGGEEDEEHIVIDLDPLAPQVIPGTLSPFINMTVLSWLTKSVLGALLSIGDIGIEEDLNEFRRIKTGKKKRVVRGGKTIRLPVFKKVGKKRLSSKQKMALRKARKKAHTGGAKRKRAKSKRLRKSRGL